MNYGIHNGAWKLKQEKSLRKESQQFGLFFAPAGKQRKRRRQSKGSLTEEKKESATTHCEPRHDGGKCEA